MLLYLLDDLLEWFEWHPHNFGVTWTDFLLALALMVPFLWMVYRIILEVIQVNGRIREHDIRTAKSMEILQRLGDEQGGDTPDECKKDR